MAYGIKKISHGSIIINISTPVGYCKEIRDIFFSKFRSDISPGMQNRIGFYAICSVLI